MIFFKNNKQHNCFLTYTIYNNNKYFLSTYQHIRMISEGSCGTED